MTIAFRSSSSAFLNSSTSLTVSVPSGTLNDDFMLLTFCSPSGGTNPTLSGWTTLDTRADPNVGFYRAYYRIAKNEPASYTVTNLPSVSTYYHGASIVSYSGVDAASPIVHPAATFRAWNGTSVTSPALTGIGADDLGVLAFVYIANMTAAAATWTPPGGSWTARQTVNNSGTGWTDGFLVVDQVGSASTATASVSGSTSSSLFCAGISLRAGRSNSCGILLG